MIWQPLSGTVVVWAGASSVLIDAGGQPTPERHRQGCRLIRSEALAGPASLVSVATQSDLQHRLQP